VAKIIHLVSTGRIRPKVEPSPQITSFSTALGGFAVGGFVLGRRLVTPFPRFARLFLILATVIVLSVEVVAVGAGWT